MVQLSADQDYSVNVQLGTAISLTKGIKWDNRILSDLFFFLVSGWFRAILPKSALRVEEEAWNAYPYTKTIYRCPFIEKFTLEIETKYQSDGGEQDNIFDLSKAELRTRTIGTYSQQEIEFHLVLLNISKTKNVVTFCIEDI